MCICAVARFKGVGAYWGQGAGGYLGMGVVF